MIAQRNLRLQTG